MFDRLTLHAPTAELADIHHTKDPAAQRTWQALRAGEPERAMVHYAHAANCTSRTPDQAAERAVQTWASLTEGRDIREVALIADASNQEIDRLNARAQHRRAPAWRTRTPRDPLARSPLRPTRRRSHRVHRTTPPARANAGRERHPRTGQRHPRGRESRSSSTGHTAGCCSPATIWTR